MSRLALAAAALLGAFAGQEVNLNVGYADIQTRKPRHRRTRYVPLRQTDEQKLFHLDRAKAKRARKSAILERLADAGAIGRA